MSASFKERVKKIFFKILYVIVPIKPLRRSLKSELNGSDNRVILIKDGKEHLKKWYEFFPKGVRISFSGRYNTVKIELPFGKDSPIKTKVNLRIKGDKNIVHIHKNVSGRLYIAMHNGNNYFEIGENSSMCDMGITLVNNTCKIGKDCMISNGIKIWGDGHSVLDYKTRKVLNTPKAPILVGNHVWLGERVTLTKGAQIPDDCIVGVASVVTKKFDKPHCVIAGVPAKVVKEGISWDGEEPVNLAKKNGEA